MGWYEAIKDGIAVAQQSDNIPLVSGLIDAQKQILDLINENNNLKEEIKRLTEQEDLSSRIERHEDAYITLKNDEHKLIYCSVCWDIHRKLIQGQKISDTRYACYNCKEQHYYKRNTTETDSF